MTLSRITDILHVMECRHPLPNRHISHFEHIRNQLVGDIADNVPLTPFNVSVQGKCAKQARCDSRLPDTVQSKQECGLDLRPWSSFQRPSESFLLVCSQPGTRRDEKLDPFLSRACLLPPICWRKCDRSGQKEGQGGPVLEHYIARPRSCPRCS